MVFQAEMARCFCFGGRVSNLNPPIQSRRHTGHPRHYAHSAGLNYLLYVAHSTKLPQTAYLTLRSKTSVDSEGDFPVIEPCDF